MKPLTLNIKHMKKISGDEKKTTFQHPDGHQISVAHSALSNIQKKQLQKLPIHNFSDGGDVKKDFEENLLPTIQSHDPIPEEQSVGSKLAEITFGKKGAERLSNLGTSFSNKLDELDNPVIPSAEASSYIPVEAMHSSVPPPVSSSAPKSPMDQMGFDQYAKSAENALNEQKQGQMGMAAANAELGKQTANIEEKNQLDMKNANEQLANARAPIEQERAMLTQEIANGDIDAKKYVNSMSTGGKISTAIGLILGGLGSGLSGGPNVAAQFLQKQIDSDMEAQKANLGKKENLLSHNLQRTKNLNEAYAMTRIQQNDLVAAHLRQAAGTAQNQAGAAAAINAAGVLDAQSSNLEKDLMTFKAQQLTTNDASSAQQKINVLSLTNPKEAEHLRERFVPGMGIANTADDAKKMKEINTDASGARDSIKRLKEINNISGKAFSPELRAEAYSISKSLIGQLNRSFTGGGPMSQGEQELLASIANNPTEIFTLDSSNKKKLDTLEKTLNTKVNSAATSMGLKPAQQSGASFGFKPRGK